MGISEFYFARPYQNSLLLLSIHGQPPKTGVFDALPHGCVLDGAWAASCSRRLRVED